ncbi:MAG: YigZ family protein [Campylobacterota bacterium]|nr:YigZ family protein [Campylobacterota bacterium]
MVTIAQHYENMLVIKQSKFIAHLVPFYMYKTLLEELKLKHPKARHFVTAFRYLNELDQIVEGSSDDGEPRGTSGKPTLAVLQGNELINIAVITVRYFGGTKLGTGGLVRAYGDATNLVVENAELSEYKKEFTEQFTCKYSVLQLVEYELEQCGITRVEKSFEADKVQCTIVSDAISLENFFIKVKRTVEKCDA